ncbi:MAG: sugar phosphate nucleotidyltransferase, partial [Thermonemataceae bacterium]|nr:sugar phosphate nucleotidyltransferase [Thermonemataceae bacterium]
MNHNYLVVMAGGIGSRFWPFSRNTSPKQFHDILGTGKSLLQQTIDRFESICPIENIYVVGSQEHQELLREQLPFLKQEQILLEPYRRNTAPCVAFAAYKIFQKDPEANLVVAPADHIILKEKEFERLVLQALEESDKNEKLITLGIKPTRPDTGYGYIQFLETDSSIKKVKIFTEKP